MKSASAVDHQQFIFGITVTIANDTFNREHRIYEPTNA